MITSEKRSFLWVCACLFFLCSCSGFKEVKVSKIEDFNIKHIDTKGIEAEIEVTIENPNAVGFRVYRSSAALSYGSLQLGTARLAKKVKIPANSKQKHTFVLKSSFDGISLAEVTSLFNGRGKKLELKGELNVGRFLFRKKIPVQHQQTISLK